MSPIKKTAYIPPYISGGEFAKFMAVLRHRIPDPVTPGVLKSLGFSNSNSYTLFGTLKAMGLYDEKGKGLNRQDLLDLGSKDEITVRDVLERIFNRTYADWLERNSVEDATQEKLETYFVMHGAVKSISVKAARLFIWIAQHARLMPLKGVEPNAQLEMDMKSTEKPKENKHSPKKERVAASHKNDSTIKVRTADEAEDWLLNTILEKISSTGGLPPVEMVREARELIAAKRERSKTHEQDVQKETINAE